MGGLFDAIGDFFGSVVDAIWDAVCSIMDAVWKFISHNIIEPIMNFLGFEDETIIMTDVIATKVFDKSILPETITQAAIKKQIEGINTLGYLGEFDAKGNTQFNKYFRKGKSDYIDHLPECQINAISIPTSDIQKVIERELNTTIKINDVLVGTPADTYWCKYQLQELYDYNISTDFAIIDDIYYIYKNGIYNSNTNKFDITLDNLSSIREKIYETVSVFVAGTVEVEDENKNENEDGNENVGEGEDNTAPLPPTTVTKEIKRTLVYNYSVFERVDTGQFLYETDETLTSSTDELVDVGSTVASTDFYLADDIIRNYEYKPLKFSINNHNNERCFTVIYTKNDYRIYLWIYNTSTNKYPELKTPVDKLVGFETYPVVMLRNSFFNVDEYDVESKNTDDGVVSRPPTITKERYNDTVEMISSLGLHLDDLIDAYQDNPDVDKMQDVFFGLAISPSNTSEIVSKVLYEIFDFIYDELPPINYSDMYSASFKEEPFNAAITWLPKAVEIYEDVIGDVGFCKHTISNASYRAIGSVRTIYKYLGKNTWRITTQDVSEVYREGELISISVLEETVKEKKDYNDRYYEHTETDVKEDTTTNGKDLTIECQLTSNTVKRLILHNLSGFHIIRRGVKNGGVSLPVDNKNFVMPLPVPVIERLSIIEKTALLSEAVYMIFYAYDEQHLRWYETEEFMNFLQIVMIVIVIVITIISLGTATGPAMSGYAAAQAVLAAIGKMILIAVVCHVALKFIASTNWSPALKAALSAAVMVAGAAFGGGFSIDLVMTALTLTTITANAVSIFIGERVKDLQDTMNSVYSRFEERKSTLDEAQDALDTGVDTEFVTELALMDNASFYQHRLYTVDQWRYMMIDASRDRSSLFTNPVERIKDNFNNLYATY